MIGRGWSVSRGRRLALLGSIAVLIAACGSSAGLGNGLGRSSGSPEGAGPAKGPVSAPSAVSVDEASGPMPAPGAAIAAVPTDLLIIKTGSLTLQVGAIDASLSTASERIGALGGYVSGSQRSGDGEAATATVTYRIPAARWDDALAALRDLAKKVVGEGTQSQEVTGQVLDLGARIDNLQATERALQAIMAKAIKISDVLEVQGQLTDVRGQIEQLETEKKHLEEQSAYGTLTVTFGLETVAVVEAQKGWDPAAEVDRATATLVELGQAVAAAAIWLAIVWLPVLLILGLFGLAALLVIRRLRRAGPRGAGPTGGPDEGTDLPSEPSPTTTDPVPAPGA